MSSKRTKRPTVNDLALEVAKLQARVAELQRKEHEDRELIEETRMTLAPKNSRRRGDTLPASPNAARMAKGSARIPTIADSTLPGAVTMVAQVPLASRIEALLRTKVMSYGEIVDELGEDDARVSGAFAAMRRKGQVYMVGTEDRPRWTWVVGDEVETPALHALVERLVRERPLAFAEIAGATGANPNRLKHALTTLQSRPQPVRNLGSRGRAVWFLPPPPPGKRR